jgi:UDP-3-O-acyl N-acetylglucosamine deacetylase
LRYALRQQRTIARTVCVEGFGYWSGQDVCVEFRPAAADSGVVFVRRDAGRLARVKAEIRNRIDVPRRTSLSAAGAAVEMVEHVMAALAGMGVDNCEVWTDSAEMPGCDGSSLPFVKAFEAAGLVQQGAFRPRLVVTEAVRAGDGQCWVEARPNRWPGLSLAYELDYPERRAIGRQRIELNVTRQSFRRELAPARTFILQEEAQWLRSQGLGERVTCRDLLVFDDSGPLQNPLRFEDECVRHKALDLLGDLALTGCDFIGRVVAHRSGHRQNAELVRALLAKGTILEQQRKIA